MTETVKLNPNVVCPNGFAVRSCRKFTRMRGVDRALMRMRDANRAATSP